jgi:hypothetical protein
MYFNVLVKSFDFIFIGQLGKRKDILPGEPKSNVNISIREEGTPCLATSNPQKVSQPQ